jgi:polysaccharide export outer membrane protein
MDAIRLVPKPPYKIEPLDILGIFVAGLGEKAPPLEPSATVDADGTIFLGTEYGSVTVAGMTLKEAQKAVDDHLKDLGALMARSVLTLIQSRGIQTIRGEHLVRPDGTVFLGIYGSVYVAGLPLPEAKAAVEKHLTQYFLNPNISLDVVAYNSKVFYVITDLAGAGQTVTRLPITGNETVLDAISQINGLARESSRKHIWVARPAPGRTLGEHHGDQILPVNWDAITQLAQTDTNYQLLPGDRLFIKGDSLIALDTFLGKFTAPMERLFGVSLLGRLTVTEFKTSTTGTSAGGGLGTVAGGGL